MRHAAKSASVGRRNRAFWRTSLVALLALFATHFVADRIAMARPLNPAEFTQAAIDAFAKQDPPIEAQSEGLLSIKLADSRPGQKPMSLNTVYREYMRSQDELDAILDRFVNGIHGAVAAPEFTRDDRLKILPILKSGKWMKDAAEKAAAGGTLIAERWNGVYVLYGVDRKGITAFLREEDLEKVGVPPRSIRELAARNLGRLAQKHNTHYVDPFWVVEVDRRHEAGLLLVEEFWNTSYFATSGDIVVAVPASGVLIVGDAGNWGQVDRLRQMAAGNYDKERYGVSPKVFIRREGRFYLYGAGDSDSSRARGGSRRGFWFWD